jgi:hypothetical protein
VSQLALGSASGTVPVYVVSSPLNNPQIVGPTLVTSTATSENLTFIANATPAAAWFDGSVTLAATSWVGTNFATTGLITPALAGTNWATGSTGGTDTNQFPQSTTTVNFNTTNNTNNPGATETTTLDSNFTVAGVVFNAPGGGGNPASTIIAPGTGGNGAANTLTVGSGGITSNANSGANSITANVGIAAPQAWTNNSGLGTSNALTVSGQVSGTSTLTTAGSGTTILSGANTTFSGPVNVTAGTLTLNGPVTLLSGTQSGGMPTSAGGAITAGSGGTANDLPGTLTLANAANKFGESSTAGTQVTYNWKLANATGAGGTGFDTLAVTGLSIGTVVDVVPISLGSAQASFNPSGSYTWDIVSGTASGGGQVGTLFAQFQLDGSALNGPTGFAASLNAAPSNFSIVDDDGDVAIQYNATPEPTSMMLLGLGAGGLMMRRRRRQTAKPKTV